jgi:DNA-damage-inducible protein D
MKREIISQLHSSFELAVNETDGVEYWFARDLQELLGYSKGKILLRLLIKPKQPVPMQNRAYLTIFLTSGKWLT